MRSVSFMFGIFGALVAGLVPLYAFCYLLYCVIGLPLRRQERARMFLDLIETGMVQGRSIENTIVSISRTRDTSVGVRFHLLAEHLQSGWSLIPALQQVGGLLPPQLTAMLQVGTEIGDPRRVLPACRSYLRDGAGHVQSAYNYLVVLAFVFIPIVPLMLWMMTVFVVPKYQQIFADMLEGAPLPFLPFKVAAVLSQVQLGIALAFYIGAICYIGGPRLLQWLSAGLAVPSLDAFVYRIPWRRKRMHRDFAAMLGLLLDAGVPESRAVLLAGQSTANAAFIKRTERVAADLTQGAKLTEAISRLDDTGEFRWRLSNALHAGRRFFAALQGWLEALDARAFREQQTFAQLVTTGLVLYNGLMVALFAVFVFRGLTMILEEGLLW